MNLTATDNTRYSIPAVWSPLYAELKNSPWETEDLDNALYNLGMAREKIPAAEALKFVYDLARQWGNADQEDAVLAVLRAAAAHNKSTLITPGQVKRMAWNFTLFYSDPEEVLVVFLQDHYNGVPLEWLTEDARRIVEKAAQRPEEIWVGDDEKLPGLWVFNKPGN